MSEPQQVVYHYSVRPGDRLQIPWHTTSRVVHTAFLDNSPDSLHFWVAMPMQPALFSREFYVVGTGMLFPATDVVDGVAVWEGKGRMLPRIVFQLVRHEPGHTTN